MIQMPDVWLSFDGVCRDYPVEVSEMSVSYESDFSSATYPAPMSYSATVASTLLRVTCRVFPPPGQWKAVIVNNQRALGSAFMTLRGSRLDLEIIIQDGRPPVVTRMNWNDPTTAWRYV